MRRIMMLCAVLALAVASWGVLADAGTSNGLGSGGQVAAQEQATATGPAIVAPTGTIEETTDQAIDAADDDDTGPGRATLIIGAVAVVVALAVVATLGRRAFWR